MSSQEAFYLPTVITQKALPYQNSSRDNRVNRPSSQIIFAPNPLLKVGGALFTQFRRNATLMTAVQFASSADCGSALYRVIYGCFGHTMTNAVFSLNLSLGVFFNVHTTFNNIQARRCQDAEDTRCASWMTFTRRHLTALARGHLWTRPLVVEPP